MCQLTGFNLKQYNELRHLLSYTETQVNRFSGYASKRHYLFSRRGDFPAGLLYLIDYYLTKNKITDCIRQDMRIRPTRPAQDRFVLNLPYSPYPEQLEAAKAALKYTRGVITAPTGSGKSWIAALIINELQARTLIIVPSLELKRQLTEDLKKLFGSKKVGSKADKRDIAVENVGALDTKKEETFYDAVIIDEFHHAGAKTYRDLNKKCWGKVYFKVGLSATPFRSKDEERLLLESVLSQVIYKIEFSTAVSKGYIVPLEAFFYILPKIDPGVDNRHYASVYNKLIINREDRNLLIRDTVMTLFDANASTLVLVQQIEHGKALKALLEAQGYVINFANGGDEESKGYIADFTSGKDTVLIASSIVGEGCDVKPCEFVILAGGVGKSKVRLMQNCGRALRRYGTKTSGKVIAFLDPSHKYLMDHHRAFVKTLVEEYNISPVKL